MLRSLLLGGDFSIYVGLTESEKLSLEGTFSTDYLLCYWYVLISVHHLFFPTNVVPGGDFSFYVGLTESEQRSLEGTFSTDCHVNVSLLPVCATKFTPSFLSDQCCPRW